MALVHASDPRVLREAVDRLTREARLQKSEMYRNRERLRDTKRRLTALLDECQRRGIDLSDMAKEF